MKLLTEVLLRLRCRNAVCEPEIDVVDKGTAMLARFILDYDIISIELYVRNSFDIDFKVEVIFRSFLLSVSQYRQS